MDTTFIFVIVLFAVFCIGGPIIGHYASIASEKAQKSDSDNAKSK